MNRFKIPLRLLDWKKLKKTGKGYTKREWTVVQLLKDISKDKQIRSLLSVGFHDYQDIRNRWWIDLCRKNNINWHILEIFQKNVERYKTQCPLADIDRITCGDVREIDTLFSNKFDIIIHWHGPEHLYKEDFLHALPKIENTASMMIIFGCPNGVEEQAVIYGNPYEEHVSFWSTDEFNELGYKTILIQDKRPGHITAYKYI